MCSQSFSPLACYDLLGAVLTVALECTDYLGAGPDMEDPTDPRELRPRRSQEHQEHQLPTIVISSVMNMYI